MSWSLGETGAIALKATRGAGMTWGLAEEASEAIVWLQGRGLPGVAALCRYLNWYSSHWSLMPEWTGTLLENTANPYCPFSIGTAISDGAIEIPDDCNTEISLGLIRQPLLLFPFVSNCMQEGYGFHIGEVSVLFALGKEILVSHSDMSNILLVDQAECFIRPISEVPNKSQPEISSLRLPDCYGGCIEVLNTFAGRIYAPSTELSRSRGAGGNSNIGD